MECEKIGEIIRKKRLMSKLTQLELANMLGVSDKTVSKWERGKGCPDISLLSAISELLCVALSDLLKGELCEDSSDKQNMKNTKYYICPACGSITLACGGAQVSCCGNVLSACEALKAQENEKLKCESIENEWYITSDHPMTKDDYISFVAFATAGHISVYKQYPQWELMCRIPKSAHGMLLWYSEKQGLKYQLI